MKILITGGAGYIGSHLTLRLVKEGHNVTILDNFIKDTNIRGIIRLINGKVGVIKEDVRKAVLTEGEYDVIIHLAGLKSVTESDKDPLSYFSNNVLGTANLTTQIKGFKVKPFFIFSSTCAVYGNKGIVSEDTPLNPLTYYAKTKVQAENLIRESGAPYLIFRYFNPVGRHPSNLLKDRSEDRSLFSNIEHAFVTNKPLKIFGGDYPTKDGTPVRDFIHINDLVHAHVLALSNKEAKNKVINLGSGTGYSVKEIAEAKKVPYEIVQRREGDIAEIFSRADLVRSIFDWSPLSSLDYLLNT